MKTNNFIIAVTLLFSAGLMSCSDSWNNHYQEEEPVVNNPNISVVKEPATAYLKQASDYSSMYQLFEETGVIKTMDDKAQLYTVLVVNNNAATGNAGDRDYLAKSHIADVALSPSNVTDGQRLLMWNGKYLNLTLTENPDKTKTIYFNGAKAVKITKTEDAYIYELESYVEAPKSMYEIIKGLPDTYSYFRNKVLSYEKKAFDREASMPIGVDATGSTVYDSVFVDTNPYFEAKSYDMKNEALTATMLIPSNEVWDAAMAEAKQRLADWHAERQDSMLSNFIFGACFYNKTYQKQDFDNEANKVGGADDIMTSIFNYNWKPSVQELDFDNPLKMSNGMAYYIKKVKVPGHILIYRLKDYFKWYEFLTEEQKAEHYVRENLDGNISLKTEVSGWSGWPGVFPNIENRVIRFRILENPDPAQQSKDCVLTFIPFKVKKDDTGSIVFDSDYLIPPGEYDLCMGFQQKMRVGSMRIFFNDNPEQVGVDIPATTFGNTTFHYDRGQGGYPEGYETNHDPNKKGGNYDRDGGKIGTVTVTGDARPVKIRIEMYNCYVNTDLQFHHWCLKPTKNFY